MRARVLSLLPRVGLGLGCLACLASAVPVETLTQTFKGRSYDPKLFRATGANTYRAIKAEAEGLRITLPAKQASKLPVGLVSRVGARGDFEITLAYEIVRVDRPTSGHGAGVTIWIATASAGKTAATLGHLVRPGGERVFFSHHAATRADGEREHHGGKPVPTTAASGRVRLVRRGTMLSYQVAEGNGAIFREIYEANIGPEDLATIRFAADNGGSPTAVDVRLKAISIRAEQLGTARSPAQPWPGRWLLWFGGALLALLLAGGGYWLWRSRG